MARKNFEGNSAPRRALVWGALGNFLFASLFFISFFASPAIAQKKGVYHVVTKGVTLYRISLAYKIPIAKIMEANDLSSPSAIQVGRKLLIPGAKVVRTVEPFSPLTARERGDLEHSLETEEKRLSGTPPWLGKELDIIWPIQGKINSPYGPRGKKFHNGIDIASPSYQEVKAAMDGEVILARNGRKGYGNVVVLRHDLGYSTIYGHMSVIISKEGEAVRQGQAIGGVGSTGNSTGPHLHFELRRNGHPLDPLSVLPMTIEEFLEKASKR
jgi:murein DD-endopeptidase MepM/ murein hydrolase activator NlpD